MMKYRKLTGDGDYTLGRRDQFHEGRDAVAQAAVTRLRLLQGEWWEDAEDGLPMYQEIIGAFRASDYRAEQIDLLFSERILGTRGVAEILSFESEIDPATRTYSARCTVQTAHGEEFALRMSGGGRGPLSAWI